MGGTREVRAVLDKLDNINPNGLLDTILVEPKQTSIAWAAQLSRQDEIVAGTTW